MATFILGADPCEHTLPTTITSTGLLIPTAGGGKFAIADRDTTWAGDTQAHSYRSLVNANSEGGEYRLGPNVGDPTGGKTFTRELMYVQTSVSLSAVPASASNRLGLIGGTTFYNNWTPRLGTDGVLRLFDAAPTQQAIGSRVWVGGTKYHVLYEFDATNGIINIYISADNGTHGLSSLADWATPDLTITDAAQNGTINTFFPGFSATAIANPNATFNLDPVVFSSDKPAWPRKVRDSRARANGTYSGASTEWNNADATDATVGSVDDTASAGANDADYVICPRLASDPAPVSWFGDTCATMGMATHDTPLAVIVVNRIQHSNSSSDATSIHNFILLDGTEAEDTGTEPPGTAATWRQMWSIFTTAPDGSAWTQAKIDAMEFGLKKIGTSSGGTAEWQASMMGFYVVTEAHPSLVVPSRMATLSRRGR